MKAEEGNGFFRIIFLVKLFFLSGFRLLIENEGGEGGCVGRVKAITNDGDRYFSSGDSGNRSREGKEGFWTRNERKMRTRRTART